MARRLFPLLILLPAINLPVAGQGTTTYTFLRDDVGARAAALGGSFVSGTDDPNAIFYNPAAIATLSAQRVSVGFYKHLLDINAGYASFGTEIPELGFVGAGILYENYGQFDRTGEEGQNLGTFGAGDLAVVAGYGSELRPGLKYGASAKFIYSSIAEARSSAAAIDLGLQYAAVPDRVLLGASLLNLGTQLDPYMGTRESLPLDFRIGAALYPEHLPAAIMLEMHTLNEYQDTFTDRFKNFSAGAEFTVSPNVQLRFGYNNQRRRDFDLNGTSGLAGISLGIGISSGSYLIDYSFNSYGEIGAVHRISVGF